MLILVTLFLYFLNLGSFQVWSPNEAFYADSARRMLQSGDFINPYYNGELRLNKPPMTYWLVSLGYLVVGVNEWGLRLMHAFLGVATGLLTLFITKELTGSWSKGLFGLIVLLLSLQFFGNAQYASPEIPFTFFITLSLYLWLLYYKRRRLPLLVFAFVSSSLAMLVKGPAGFVIPAGVVFLYLLLTDPRELLKLRYYLLSGLALIMGLWWHIYQFFTKGGLFWEIFYKENLKRIYHGKEPFYFYFLDLQVSFLPYSLMFLPALIWILLKVREDYKFPLVWFLFVYGLFSLVSQKIPVYVLPAFPAIAIMTSGFVLSEDWKRLKKVLVLIICFFMAIALMFGVFIFSLSYIFLVLAPLPFLLFLKDYRLSPALSSLILLLVLKTGLLNQLEEKRKIRELGEYIKKIDPGAYLPVYQAGHFHHSLPFYAERSIKRDTEPKEDSLVLFKVGSFKGCEPIKTFRLYTGSESRLFRFFMDARRNRNFEEFGLCHYRPGT
ncbi:MAG: glycosyltransferase family 39 protein [Aquificaceae bacterium]|nr:glycosyltransferase family 39 protein [Aquificaceae bacterium]